MAVLPGPPPPASCRWGGLQGQAGGGGAGTVCRAEATRSTQATARAPRTRQPHEEEGPSLHPTAWMPVGAAAGGLEAQGPPGQSRSPGRKIPENAIRGCKKDTAQRRPDRH